MKLLNKFNQTFGFTETESKIVLFLVLAFIVGMGIKVFKSNYSTTNKFNYASLDSEFIQHSQTIQRADSSYDSMVANQASNYTTQKNASDEKLLVDVNKASKDELIKLPGVGETMALRIINYRENYGVFVSIDDLMKVKGIGKKKLEKLAPHITVGK